MKCVICKGEAPKGTELCYNKDNDQYYCQYDYHKIIRETKYANNFMNRLIKEIDYLKENNKETKKRIQIENKEIKNNVYRKGSKERKKFYQTMYNELKDN